MQPMKPFSLDHLTDTEFEEFCFDLLNAMGATRMNWRKGTGYDSSPADQGRDIECYFARKDIDGQTPERWFVECKHHRHGVPPEKLQGILTSAVAERPDVVLIIASNFLSNPAKNYLETYQRNNNPPFRIKRWERPDLERHTLGKPLVMRKYGLGGEFEFLNILHPAHVCYLRRPPGNTLEYFFNVLDGLETRERESFFDLSFHYIINPRSDEPTDFKRQTPGDLIREKVNYTEFRNKCYKLALHVCPYFLIQGIVFQELSAAFACADKTNVQQARESMRQTLSTLKDELRKPNTDTEALEQCITLMTDRMEHIEETTDKHYEQYCSFCEKVVGPLLEEKHPIPEWLRRQMEEYERRIIAEKNPTARG